MSDSWYRFFIERSWTLSVQRVAETNKSISQLHQDEMDQWNALVEEENPISNRSWNLVPELLGFTADHGARRKSVNPDSTEKRCGECPLSLCKQLSAAGHAFFLDWEYLLGAVEVTISNCFDTNPGPSTWTHALFQSSPMIIYTISWDIFVTCTNYCLKTFLQRCERGSRSRWSPLQGFRTGRRSPSVASRAINGENALCLSTIFLLELSEQRKQRRVSR